MEEQFETREIPSLPTDKDFHFFVCYTSENLNEVQIIVDHLEKEGVKCSYHERDFQPGQRVLDNINDTIRRSIHMLVILSTEFMNRGYCKHEVIQALHEKINEDYSIIPIKIEPCTVPDYLKHITYIDAENDVVENMHLKIIDALIKGMSDFMFL